jgi:phosphate starvation-inducible PhoH-like protein
MRKEESERKNKNSVNKNMGNKDKQPREDKSLRVPQKDKIQTELNIRKFPFTSKQQELIRLIQDKNSNIILVKGPAGTAKSLIAVYAALEALNNKKIGEIVYVRSVVESSSHSMGFLPGDSKDKLSPYLQPLLDKLDELLPPNQVKGLVNEEKVRGLPIGFMRGLSINTAYIIGDEAQNFTLKELLTLSTRVGKFSKLLICGDIKQADIHASGFEKMYDSFSSEEAKKHGIVTFEFGIEDIMRSEVIKYIIEIFEKLDSKGDWTPSKKKTP